MSRRFLTAAVSTVAVMTGAAPLWADNITVSPPAGNTVWDDAALAAIPHGVDDILVFENDVTFQDGVKVTTKEGDDTNLQFNGDVTFNINTKGNNSLDINQLIFAKKNADDASVHQLTVTGNEELNVGEAEVFVNTDLKINFGGNSSISTISKLTLGANSVSVAPVTLSFNDTELLDVAELNIGKAGATIVGPVEIGTPEGDDITSGLKAKNMVINKNAYINGPLTGGGTELFTFNTKASVLVGGKDAEKSDLGESTIVIGGDLLTEVMGNPGIDVISFKPIDIQDPAAPGMPEAFQRLAASLDVKEAAFPNNGYGEAAYDRDNGYLVLSYYGTNADKMAGVPAYGVPYVDALYRAADETNFQNHKALAVAIMGAAKTADVSADLNTLMGNIPNAALGAALSGNVNQVMSHLNSTLSPAMPGFAGPSGAAQGLWITPAYSMTDITGDQQNGYGDMEIKNPGVTIGYDRWINERIKLGVFAAMSQPKIEGDYQTIDTKNMQAGLYGQAQLNYGINVNMGLAYSTQSHDAEREIPADILAGAAPFAAQKIDSSFGGDTISAALEVSRLYPLAANSFIRPTVGYSYVATSVDGYSEKSTAAAPGDSLAQKVESTDMTMHLVRVGAEGGWSNDLTTVTGRLFWVGNMGDTQPKTQAALITDDSIPFNIIGAEYDKNMVNIGLGVKYVPPQTQGLTFGLNYDALLGSNAKNHSLSLMMRYEF